MEQVEYEDTEHYRVTKTFLNSPDFYGQRPCNKIAKLQVSHSYGTRYKVQGCPKVADTVYLLNEFIRTVNKKPLQYCRGLYITQ